MSPDMPFDPVTRTVLLGPAALDLRFEKHGASHRPLTLHLCTLCGVVAAIPALHVDHCPARPQEGAERAEEYIEPTPMDAMRELLPEECPNCKAGPDEWAWGLDAVRDTRLGGAAEPRAWVACDACSETLTDVDLDIVADLLDRVMGFGRG